MPAVTPAIDLKFDTLPMSYPGKMFTWRALAPYILVVGVVDDHKVAVNQEWTAYIGVVPGRNHDEEWQAVARTGTKLSREIAGAVFPELALTYRWRA